MKKMKVFYGDKRLRDIYPHATKWEVLKYNTAQFMRKVFIVFVGSAFTTIIFLIMQDVFVNSEIERRMAEMKPEVVLENKSGIPPVMERIAECESGNRHFKDNGQVVTNLNSGRSLDIGRYQINEKVWGKKAGEMKLDLTDEEDNETMALWIYANFGTEDWKYSAHCWKY